MKQRYNFRLSDDAAAILQQFVQQYGLTQTTVVELALRVLDQHPPLLPPKKEDAHD